MNGFRQICSPRPGGFINSAVSRGVRSWIGCLWLAGGLPAAVLNGPYVLLEDASTLRIRFEVDRPEYDVVLLRGAGDRVQASPDFRRGPRDTFIADVPVKLTAESPFAGYEIRPPGEPAAAYDWRSRIDGTLRSAPRLLLFGDSQGGSQTLRRLGAQWSSEDFDAIVGLGDLADAGSRYESWREEFFEPLREMLPHRPFLPVCGNHDSYREKSLAWFDWYLGRGDGRRFARLDFGDLRLIVLNNSDVHTKYGFDPIDPLTPQYDFLVESTLGATAQDKRIAVFCHVPIISGSTVVNREFGSELQRKYLLPILERAPVLGLFAGHHHKYERATLPGIRGPIHHVVSGGGGGRLFTRDRARGGFAMEREVFEIHHYLLVDFATGSVVARALGGEQLDSFSTGTVRRQMTVNSAHGAVLWRARVDPDLTLTPGERLGAESNIGGRGAHAQQRNPTAEILQTERGLVALAQNLGAAGSASVSLQGYDWARKSWSYLQGGALVIPVQAVYAHRALISINGADLSPLQAAFPVLHWPVAEIRAGVSPEAGAVMLLRGRRDFDLAADPARLIEKWRWGVRSDGEPEVEQRDRQWSLLDAPPQPRTPATMPLRELNREMIRSGRPEGMVVRENGAPPVAALVHWPAWGTLAVVVGESIADTRGSIFIPADSNLRIEIADANAGPALRLTRSGVEPLTIPLGWRKPTQ